MAERLGPKALSSSFFRPCLWLFSNKVWFEIGWRGLLAQAAPFGSGGDVWWWPVIVVQRRLWREEVDGSRAREREERKKKKNWEGQKMTKTALN